MRKWMKDRLQRRKKKAPEQGSEPAPPPLQPAYFDADQAPNEVPASGNVESSHHEAEIPVASERELEAQPAGEESVEGPEQQRQPAASGEGARGRGRRRRGGRGRGGRGREQAVAQAFTPAAAKGIIPDAGHGSGADTDADAVPVDDSAEPESAPAPQALETRAAKTPAAIPAAPPRPPKGIVVLAIGLPGSGKSS